MKIGNSRKKELITITAELSVWFFHLLSSLFCNRFYWRKQLTPIWWLSNFIITFFGIRKGSQLGMKYYSTKRQCYEMYFGILRSYYRSFISLLSSLFSVIPSFIFEQIQVYKFKISIFFLWQNAKWEKFLFFHISRLYMNCF